MDATQDPTSSVLSTTAVQNWFMHYSIGKNRRNSKDDTSAMVKSMESSSRHLYLLRLHDWFHVCKLYSSPMYYTTHWSFFSDSVVFSTISIWCACQTGNSLKVRVPLQLLCNFPTNICTIAGPCPCSPVQQVA
jgi:hypothetical protein